MYHQGLYYPSFKFLVSAKKVWFPVVAHKALRVWNLCNSTNSKQNSGKNSVYEKGIQKGLVYEKIQRTEISHYSPFKLEMILRL